MVAIAFVEIVFEVPSPGSIPFHNVLAPYVGFLAPPSTTWRSATPSPSSHGHQIAVEYTNEDSLRIASTESPTRKKPEGRLRVAMLGGSAVRIGTVFDLTLAGALQAELRRRHSGIDIEVLNAGITSAVSGQELVYLLTTMVDYEPDIVLVYDGLNDSGQMLYYERRVGYPYNQAVLEKAWEQFVAARRDPLWLEVARRSVILNLLWPGFGVEPLLNPVPASELERDERLRWSYANAHRLNWEKMSKVCAAHGAAAFFVLQATSLYSLLDRPERSRGVPPETLAILRANRLVYDALRETSRGFASAHPGRVLDLSGFLPQEAFFDGAHVFDEFNATLAKPMAALIEGEIAARAGSALRRSPH